MNDQELTRRYESVQEYVTAYQANYPRLVTAADLDLRDALRDELNRRQASKERQA